MSYLLIITFKTGTQHTLEFPRPTERALVAAAVARWVADLRCEDRP